jgi:hypothetical protein
VYKIQDRTDTININTNKGLSLIKANFFENVFKKIKNIAEDNNPKTKVETKLVVMISFFFLEVGKYLMIASSNPSKLNALRKVTEEIIAVANPIVLESKILEAIIQNMKPMPELSKLLIIRITEFE